jgi:ERCC4-type nuclease
MYPIIVDIHEPDEIKLYLKKTLDVIVRNNEPEGFSDYYWNFGQVIMWERKKGGELVSEIGNKLDEQLLKYQGAHPNAIICILQEGMVTPTPDNQCQTWKKMQRKGQKQFTWVRDRIIHSEYTAYRAYLFAREMEGIPVIFTEDERDTALALSSMVYNSMKSSHEGLRANSPLKRKRKKGETQQKNTFITTLLTNKGIGEKTATRLMTEYGTPWDIYSLPFGILAEFEGQRIATIIFEGIGRRVP